MCGCLSDICLIIISVLFPPLPVWIRRGICSMDSLINILLCVLGYFPGLIHSWYIIAKYPPYQIHQQSKIYYIYHNDLEQGHGPSQEHHHHSHNHTHNHAQNSPQPINQQPPVVVNPSYGAVNEGSSSGNPPPYTELDKNP